MKNETQPHILIIEDEANLRRLYCEELSDEGWFCSGVATGEEAVDFLTRNSVDLILLDIKLPDTTGIELLQKIKPLASQTPVFIVTALSQLKNHFAFTDTDEFVTKSSDLTELKTKVREYLEKRSQVA